MSRWSQEHENIKKEANIVKNAIIEYLLEAETWLEIKRCGDALFKVWKKEHDLLAELNTLYSQQGCSVESRKDL